MTNILIKQSYLDEIILIIKKLCPNAVVWAYGSRVDGTAHAGSDLDLAVTDFGQEKACLYELQEEFKKSNIPFLIDIFELNKFPQSFQAEIEKNHVVIYNGQKKSTE